MAAEEPGISGKVALVTGAAGVGIGRATAATLLAAGARVVVTDQHAGRTAKVTEELSREHGDRVIGLTLDVSDPEAIDAVTTTIAREFGPIQILVNNAAQNVVKDVLTISLDEWALVMGVNLTGPWYLSRAVLPTMAAAGGGVIINLSTVAADYGADVEPAYAVSKGGLNVLTRVLARHGGPANIRCNAVAMSLIEDTFFARRDPSMGAALKEQTPLRRLPQASDVADAVLFLASDRARNISGEILNVAAGYFMRT